jgi:hypothetical protein
MKPFTLCALAALLLTSCADTQQGPAAAGGSTERPVAVFDGPRTARVGEPVIFDGSQSSDVDGTVVAWSFLWGDGSPEELSTAPRGLHIYRSPGLFVVDLSAIDDRGSKGSVSYNLLVTGSAEGSGEGSGDGSGEGSGDGSGIIILPDP